MPPGAPAPGAATDTVAMSADRLTADRRGRGHAASAVTVAARSTWWTRPAEVAGAKPSEPG